MRCPSCGAPTNEEDRFCQKCGAAIAPTDATSGPCSPRASKPSIAFLVALVAVIGLVIGGAWKWPAIRAWVSAETSKPPVSASPPPNVRAGSLSEGPLRSTPGISPPVVSSAPPAAVPTPAGTSFSAQQLIGSWRGGRHLMEYRADGTFLLDPDIVPEPAGGTWKLEGNRLTETFRAGNGFTLTIESLSEREMITSDTATGNKYVSHRENIIRVGFDQVKAGSMSSTQYRVPGLRIAAVKGTLSVMPAAPSMVMRNGRKQLLMISGDRVTEMAFEFDPPARAFTITLPGIGGGSSFPTYRMTAYNRAGQAFNAIGQEHWIPARPVPARITMNQGEMVRAVLSVDNRFGNTAWATFSCLPISEIEVER